MQNYNTASEEAKKIMFQYLKKRMVEKKITHIGLARLINVKDSTLRRNFNLETEMLFTTFLKICGALEIRPYLVPAENDNNEKQFVNFN